MPFTTVRVRCVAVASLATVATLLAPHARPDDAALAPGLYYSHDQARPRPPVIAPASDATLPQPPPGDAIVLFDGKNLDAWKRERSSLGIEGPADDTPTWQIENGEIVVEPKTNWILTRQSFPSCQVHIEWATPSVIKHRGQARGNSGVFLSGFNEIQILDSFENDTEADSQAAALYGRKPPRVNASRKPGEWQSFDIIAELATFDSKGRMERPARLTVLHNGVVVHHAVESRNNARTMTLALQDHHVPVRFRNIWVRPLGDEPTDAAQPPEPTPTVTTPPPAPTPPPEKTP